MTLAMAEVIEVAKTGRARCRACRQAIEKGTLRFGEEQPSAFSDEMQMAWYHLACAARKRPAPVREALARFEGEVPGREEIESLLSGAAESVASHPYAERAPTGRSKCLHCGQPIAKDALRVAVEREVEVGGMPRTGSGYLHPGCAREYTGTDDLLAVLTRNSRKLGDADREELARALAG
jgi:Poly(ADP-ribose) polymerase and DNA-Ligase Zn-finger region